MTLSMTDEHISDKIDIESNYGSDFGTDDEATISALLTKVESQSLGSFHNPILESIENNSTLPQAVFVHPSSAPVQRSRRQYVDDEGVPFEVLAYDGPIRAASLEVEYDQHNRISFSCKSLQLRVCYISGL